MSKNNKGKPMIHNAFKLIVFILFPILSHAQIIEAEKKILVIIYLIPI